MEQLLTKDAVQGLLERFHGFDDGLIRSIRIDLAAPKPQRSATIVCSAREHTTGDWCNVRWIVRGLLGFQLSEGKTSYIVLSQGIQIGWFDERIYLDLGPYTCEPDCEDDYRQSGMYFVGRQVHWLREPYNEGVT